MEKLTEKIFRIIKKHYSTPEKLTITPLSGGMVNKVYLIKFSSHLHNERFVLKFSDSVNNGFEWEYKCLEVLNKQYKLSVPQPYFYSSYEPEISCSYLGMEYWDATNMGMAYLLQEERKTIEIEIAESIAELHKNTGSEYYTLFSNKRYKSLTDIMKSKYEENMNKQVEDKIGKGPYKILLNILENLSKVFIENEKPVLVHGDIWSTNVMVYKKNNFYHLKGFIDPSPHFINREYELAYLKVFGMFSQELFKYYSKIHKIDDGFKVRIYFYWLHTMLVHVKYFGDLHYVLRTLELINICKNLLQEKNI